MTYLENYNNWISSDNVDEDTKKELLQIKDDQKAVEDRFYKNLEFGTGGLRGVIGAGCNRMNIYTVRHATQGVADYVKSCGEKAVNKGFVIAYDTRHKSDVFAKEAANILVNNGIKTYLFDRPVPTPELSFSVRELDAFGGIVITASHNPAEYNGYKVYDENGCQITVEAADMIYSVMQKNDILGIACMDKTEEIIYVGDTVEEKYLDAVFSQSLNVEKIKNYAAEYKVVYTPLHGTGRVPVEKILNRIGVTVVPVKEQYMPDPDFSTVKSPNPEEKDGLAMAIALAEKEGASLVVATDPDSDRLGVVIKDNKGEFLPLTGNQVGILLLNYIINYKVAVENPAIVKTIVTTPMAEAIAESKNIKVYNVLTGFKFIGEKIFEFEQNKNNNYLFGFEESCGYLSGTYARDKDAVVAAMLVSEMYAFYSHTLNKSLYEVLDELYSTYGYYKESLTSITIKGKAGLEKITQIMDVMRKECTSEIAGLAIENVTDYLETDKTGLPKSNVLSFELKDGRKFIIRPSGTEPKIKIYFFVKGDSENDSVNKLDALVKEIKDFINQI